MRRSAAGWAVGALGEEVKLAGVVAGPVGCLPCLPVVGSEAFEAVEGEACMLMLVLGGRAVRLDGGGAPVAACLVGLGAGLLELVGVEGGGPHVCCRYGVSQCLERVVIEATVLSGVVVVVLVEGVVVRGSGVWA